MASAFTTMRLVIDQALSDLEDGDGPMSQRIGLIMQSPTLLSQFVLLGAEDERLVAAALAERMGLPVTSVLPMLLVGASSTAVPVAMEKKAAVPDRSLRSLVDEAFIFLADGLDPAFDRTNLFRTDQEGQS
jgi:hypothetical protein